MEKVNNKKPMTKKEIGRYAYHIFLIVAGSLLLAFGTAIFLTQNTIVAGGISGISFIIQKSFPNLGNIVDIAIWIITGLLWLLSLFTLGKDFAIKTLLASILYPLFYSIFYRVDVFVDLAKAVSILHTEIGLTTGDLILDAIFGGLTIGLGVAITFVGKGSTGGLDVLAILLKKYAGVNVSIGSFVIDAAIIVAGIFILDFPNFVVNCLCGIICAFVTALVIEFVYSRNQNAFIMEAISDNWEEISKYITEEMDRGVTLIDITGAFTGRKRVILRSVLSRNEYIQIKEFIASVDPKAFVTYTSTNAVFGEGFLDHQTPIAKKISEEKKKKEKKDGK